MKRSFHVHLMGLTLLSVFLFFLAESWIVRFLADDLLLDHLHETLAHHTAREIDEAGLDLDVKLVARNLAKSIDGVQSDELRVSLDDPTFESAHLQWKRLNNQSDHQPVMSSDITLHGQLWSVLRTPISHGRQLLFVAVQRQVMVRSLEEIWAVRSAITQSKWAILAVLSVLCSLYISYAAVSPIKALQKSFAQTHRHRGYEHINTQIHYTEFAEFTRYFNALIDRLGDTHEKAARFTSDVSHELRTPLTIIRNHIDQLLQQAKDHSAQQIKLALVVDEVERLISIMDKLLLLARADAGKLLNKTAKLNVSDKLKKKISEFATYSDNLTVTSQITPKIYLLCDEALIDLLLSNLITNAVKYNVPQGWINVTAHSDGHNLHVAIHNATHLSLSSGMDARVFERFYRHRKTHARTDTQVSGSGLGLSLCREIVQAHGGSIRLQKASKHSVCFEVTLPLC